MDGLRGYPAARFFADAIPVLVESLFEAPFLAITCDIIIDKMRQG